MTKKLKIAIIAPPFTIVPPKGQGGTERIIYQMIEGLEQRGHKITLFGAGQSQTSAKFIQIFKTPLSKMRTTGFEAARALRLELVYASTIVQKILKQKQGFDIIFNHMRGGFFLLPFSDVLKTPLISILHLPIFKELGEFLASIKKPNIITVSNSQRKGFPNVNYLATVYNGINMAEFELCEAPKDYFLFMGAIGSHKNPKDAILAAKKAGVRIILAGGKKREPYFSKEILPLVDGKKIQYVGEVSGKKRLDLFRYAKAFLFPIQWPEPFGLVMAEAMACGCPVIAYPMGAAPEVVKHNKTGFIVKNTTEMAKAIKNIDKISRSDCRKWVKQNFSQEKMITAYEKAAYKTLSKS